MLAIIRKMFNKPYKRIAVDYRVTSKETGMRLTRTAIYTVYSKNELMRELACINNDARRVINIDVF